MTPAAREQRLDCLVPRPRGPHQELVVDSFLEPRHLCGLAATTHLLRSHGHGVRVSTASTPGVQTYAARMHLGAVLDGMGADHDLPRVRERRVGDRLLEVRSLHTSGDVLELAGLVQRRLRARGSVRAAAVAEAVAELGMNVPDHADPLVHHRASTGWVAAQTMPGSDEIVFAIADSGVGLLATLRARGAQDDHHAVTLALGGTSRFGDGLDRGHGLRSIEELVTGLGGSLDVVTGSSSVTSRARGRSGRRLDVPYRGTLLQARVPMR